MDHVLSNGFTAKANGKGFDLYKNGIFICYAIRLKVAKEYAKQHK